METQASRKGMKLWLTASDRYPEGTHESRSLLPLLVERTEAVWKYWSIVIWLLPAPTQFFSFPEVKRGVVAALGGIPRLARICGHQLASEMLLLGKTVDAREAQARFGFVNAVVPADQVLSTAIGFAKDITANSPDAVQSTKVALLLAQKHNVEETFHTHVWSPETKRVGDGENIQEGLQAFVEKRKPSWKNPAKL